MSEENKRKGFWDNTFNKLKAALSKTKEAVVDSVINKSDDNIRTIEPAKQSAAESVNLSAETQPLSQLQTGLQTQLRTELQTKAGAKLEVRQETSSANQQSILTSRTASATDQTPESNNQIEQQTPITVAAFTSPEANCSVVIDDEYLEHVEDKLIRADLGLPIVNLLMDHLRKNARSKNWTIDQVRSFLKNEFGKMLAAAASPKLNIREGILNVVLVVGVNGTGKTTSIGKLCHSLQCQGKKVLIAAGDTFRAAAESQLEIWAKRAGCDLVRLPDGSDPGAVVYQAIKKASSENYDVLVIDTAGRLHNKTNLMAELRKIQSVIDKNAGAANLEELLVLYDASTGQNGIQQARVFAEVCPLTGVILTKLDGTAKGGVIFSITQELKIPVKLIGLGEKIDDWQDFEPQLFIDALFG